MEKIRVSLKTLMQACGEGKLPLGVVLENMMIMVQNADGYLSAGCSILFSGQIECNLFYTLFIV